MKNKKIRLVIISSLIFLGILSFIRPKVKIYGAPSYASKVEAVMDFYDKKYDGDVSIWYIDKLEASTIVKKILPKMHSTFNYPIFYDKKGSQNFIFMYYVYDTGKNITHFRRFFVNAELLYFWRIEVTLQDDGDIKESYIKKYPWSEKQVIHFE